MAYLPGYQCGGSVAERIATAPRRQVRLYRAAGQFFSEAAIHVPGSGLPATIARRAQRIREQTVGRRYVLAEIAERDNYRCHLCGKRVDMALSGRAPMGPTADHLLPVAAGGGSDAHNVALAHRQCNVRRGVGGEVQLRLVG